MKTFRPKVDRIVGHNTFDFDLKFILNRSIIHGVRPMVDLSFYQRMVFEDCPIPLAAARMPAPARGDLAMAH